jgi:hypothetical protein
MIDICDERWNDPANPAAVIPKSDRRPILVLVAEFVIDQSLPVGR